MRVLIVGATGLLGKVLLREWSRDYVLGMGSRDADITDERQVQDLFAQTRPDWAVLAAAYTDVDGCEKNPGRAHLVNSMGAANVAGAAAEHGSRLLFLSSDYVFDGSKTTPYETDDPVCPASVYGRSKAFAEAAVRHAVPNCCVVRTSWLFGSGGKCFPAIILKLAQERHELSVVADQRGCPTYNVDLARAIIALVRVQAEGIVHISNTGDCTWHEFARAILEGAGFSRVRVSPITTAELNRPAPRPKYSVLSDRSRQRYGIPMRSWQEALADYLGEHQRLAAAEHAVGHV